MFAKILRQRSLKSIKKLLLKSAFIFFGLFLISPHLSSPVSANATTNAASATNDAKSNAEVKQENLVERNTILDLLNKVAYVIVWPLVTIAGIAMDNQMVYGSFMYLDAPLRKLRNLIKNLANFALGFLFLTGILIYVISPSGMAAVKSIKNTISSPVDLIKKTLFAGVLIQMSRFIMMVLVDLSTILTYSVGALPSSVLSQIDQENDSKVMTTNMIVDLGDAQKGGTQAENESIKFYSTLEKEGDNKKEGGNKDVMHIAPCQVFSQAGGNGASYIIERKYSTLTGPSTNTVINMEDGYCTYNGVLFAFAPYSIAVDSAPGGKNDEFSNKLITVEGLLKQATDAEKAELGSGGMIIPLFGDMSHSIEPKVINVKGVKFTPSARKKPDAKYGLISNRKECVSSGANCTSKEYQYPYSEYGLDASEIMKKANSRTGPFVTLYGSLMSYSSSVDFSQHGTSQKLLVLLLNTGFAILLILPLAALVVVLLRRIIVLWIAIAISPLIVLKKVFGGMFESWFDGADFFDFEEIIKLLFAPVIVAFCVGISLIFMSALKTTLPTNGVIEAAKEEQYRTAFKDATGIEITGTGNAQELSLLGFIKIKASIGLVNFGWLILMLFGMALTWFLLFAAIKGTKIGEKVGGELQKLGHNLLATAPIIPTSSGGIGFGSIIKAPEQLLEKQVNEIKKARNGQLDGLLNPNSDAAKENRKKSNIDNFIAGESIRYVADDNNKIERLKELEGIYSAHDAYRYSSSDLKNIRFETIKGEYERLVSSALKNANVEETLQLMNSSRVEEWYKGGRKALDNHINEGVRKEIEFKDGVYKKIEKNNSGSSQNSSTNTGGTNN